MFLPDSRCCRYGIAPGPQQAAAIEAVAALLSDDDTLADVRGSLQQLDEIFQGADAPAGGVRLVQCTRQVVHVPVGWAFWVCTTAPCIKVQRDLLDVEQLAPALLALSKTRVLPQTRPISVNEMAGGVGRLIQAALETAGARLAF